MNTYALAFRANTLDTWKRCDYRDEAEYARTCVSLECAGYEVARGDTARALAPNHPEPPRNSGEADAVNGPTALRTHRDNTRTRAPADPGARP